MHNITYDYFTYFFRVMMQRTNLQSRPESRGVVHAVITHRVQAKFGGLGVVDTCASIKEKKVLAE